MRRYLVFPLLLLLKLASAALFRVRLSWVGTPPPDPWSDLRILAILNHTSLFEPIFAAVAPLRLLWRIAAHGVAPVADKTAARPVIGRFFRLVARQVVPVTRERDQTWDDVMSRVHDLDALVVILPEGRMKRRSGLDAHGNPMTIRGGIADILWEIPRGRMLLAYSPGLHHVHAPGDRFPRLFRTVRLRVELLEIARYRGSLLESAGAGGFKAAVIHDLTRRRDAHCLDGPPHPDPTTGPAAQRNSSRSKPPSSAAR